MLVSEARHSEAIAIAVKAASTVIVGDPELAETTMGPLVSMAQFEKVQGLIQRGIDEGAQLVAGGVGRPEGLATGYFVKPTIFASVDNSMTIAREEIFGPVLCILPYKDEKDAIRIANDTPYGLAAYVESSDIDRARAIASQIRAGMIFINYPDWDASVPFGGYKQSGNGREAGEHGMNEYLEIKSVVGHG
jgi:aldehyde dehydrogenase (NAD+)